jgi:RNA polymerase sigma factor (sigma-70 family)
MNLEELARRAIAGERAALDALVRGLQADVYGLALRMLWNREDAEDATQEILLRIVDRLPQFDFRSTARTWTYRVAFNYLLDVKKSASEQRQQRFEEFGVQLEARLAPVSADEAMDSLLIDEVKVGCSLAMLQCLDRPHRAAFILGAILEYSGPEGAEILDISAALFRKRLQQARAAVVGFMRSHCGLVSDTAPCRCHKHVPAIQMESASPPAFGRRATSFADARALVRRVDEARWALQVHRTSAPADASAAFVQRLLGVIDPLVGRDASPVSG